MAEKTITQTEAVLRWLESGRTITQREAEDHLGIMRLASRINDLKREGHDIRSKRVKVPTRYGDGQTTVCAYYIETKED